MGIKGSKTLEHLPRLPSEVSCYVVYLYYHTCSICLLRSYLIHLTLFACVRSSIISYTHSDFEGFPVESDELPIDYMTEEHRTVISVKCSHPKKKKKLPFLPTFKPIVARQLSDNPNPSPSLFKYIIEDKPLPDDAFKWNKNNAVRKAVMKLKPALELIKMGEDRNLRFNGIDSNAANTEAVTRLFVFHYPPGPDDLAKLGPAERGILHAVGDASVASNYTMNTVTHQDVNILSITQGVGLDKAYPVFEGTTAVVDVFPYLMPADMCNNKNGEAYKKYLEVCKEIRPFVVEYIKAVTQLFPNLRDITFYGEAFNFLQDNPGMVDPRMVNQLELDVGGLAHSSCARFGTLREHSIAQLKVSGAYYGDMLQNPYAFDPKDPKTEMFIQSTPRLMQDEEKKKESMRKIIESGELGKAQTARWDNTRLKDIPGLVNVVAGGPDSISTICTNPKCDNNKQRLTNQTISKEDAGCYNIKGTERGLSYDVFKGEGEDAELVHTTKEGESPSRQIGTYLESQHPGQYFPKKDTIKSRLDDGKCIEVRPSKTKGEHIATYYFRLKPTSDMLKVIMQCTDCRRDMHPEDETQCGGTITAQVLYDRRDRGLLPSPPEKKAKKGKKRKRCPNGV